jgi:hypothetical protein
MQHAGEYSNLEQKYNMKHGLHICCGLTNYMHIGNIKIFLKKCRVAVSSSEGAPMPHCPGSPLMVPLSKAKSVESIKKIYNI